MRRGQGILREVKPEYDIVQWIRGSKHAERAQCKL